MSSAAADELRPIERVTFDARLLMSEHRPKLHHRNKQVVFDIACPDRAAGGTIEYSRWRAMPLPQSVEVDSSTTIESRPDVYDYCPTDTAPPVVEWHVNFADPRLFVAYGSALLAQDEMQAAEHPALGSLREALLARGMPALTIENGVPTPVLVRGVERRVSIATDANADEGRPRGLYGNRFAAADADVVARATTRIDPPTLTNLIAIAAPAGGTGAYHVNEIRMILSTAYTAFVAARVESSEAVGEHARTVIHTGFWGCGAFGGNRVLMTLLQALAARLAQVDRLIVHTFNRAGVHDFAEGMRVLDALLKPSGLTHLLRRPTATIPMSDVIARITAMNLRWGESDGN